MTCTELQGGELSQLIEHAATCTRCAQNLRATIELERVLGTPFPAKVRVDFNDAVMRRIHNHPLAAMLQVIAEPIVPLTLALAIILGTQLENIALTIHTAALLAPIVFLLSWRLFRTYERLTAPTWSGERSSS